MRDLKAKNIMVGAVVSAKENSSARDVAQRLISGVYSGMPVVDAEGKVVGVVSALDLLEAMIGGKDLGKTTAGEIMTREAITADVDTPASEIIKTMKVNNIIRLPVTEKGKLVGLVARVDLLKSLVDPELFVL